jgi:GTP-binding protein
MRLSSTDRPRLDQNLGRMSFIDEARVFVRAGRGGDGSPSMRSEPFTPRGGPDGGNGGAGGSVVLEVSLRERDLGWFRDHPHQSAEPGGPGRSKGRDGAAGEDLVLPVPDGTVVRDEDGFVADLVGEGARVVVARGGRGGRGSAALGRGRRRPGRAAERGEAGEEHRIELELRTVADVALVGLPNAGKSTLLASLTAARPKIADYPFTTLTPNLGVAADEDERFVVADVPGLVEGAHEGRGLGHRFLRHVTRARTIVEVVDLSSGDPAADLAILRAELEAFDPELAERPRIVVGTKADLVDDAPGRAVALDPSGLAVSAVDGSGIEALGARLRMLARQGRAAAGERTSSVVLRPARAPFTVRREGARFVVAGRSVERWVAETDLQNARRVVELQRRLAKAGVERRLAEMGARRGDEVVIAGRLFEYIPEEAPKEEGRGAGSP